jgi:multidrug transporter EmrE-like cation transporter
MKPIFLLVIYYVINTCAFTISVFGGNSEQLFLPCLIASIAIGTVNTWVLMRLYKKMDVNTATAVSLGGGFLITQVTVALLFKSNLSIIQYAGILTITAGLFCMVKGERKTDSAK